MKNSIFSWQPNFSSAFFYITKKYNSYIQKFSKKMVTNILGKKCIDYFIENLKLPHFLILLKINFNIYLTFCILSQNNCSIYHCLFSCGISSFIKVRTPLYSQFFNTFINILFKC